LPHRSKPRSPEGLRKNLRLRDGRWYWHWDPAFMTAETDLELGAEKFEQAIRDLTIPVLLIRGKFSDVVSPKASSISWPRAPAPSSSSCPTPRTQRPATTRRFHRHRGDLRQARCQLTHDSECLLSFRVSAELLTPRLQRPVGETGIEDVGAPSLPPRSRSTGTPVIGDLPPR